MQDVKDLSERVTTLSGRVDVLNGERHWTARRLDMLERRQDAWEDAIGKLSRLSDVGLWGRFRWLVRGR